MEDLPQEYSEAGGTGDISICQGEERPQQP